MPESLPLLQGFTRCFWTELIWPLNLSTTIETEYFFRLFSIVITVETFTRWPCYSNSCFISHSYLWVCRAFLEALLLWLSSISVSHLAISHKSYKWSHAENADKGKMWESSSVFLKLHSPSLFTHTPPPLHPSQSGTQSLTHFNCIRHMIQTKFNKPSSWRFKSTAVISHSCSPKTYLLPTAKLTTL